MTFKELMLEPTATGRPATLPSEVKSPHLMPQQAFQQVFLLDLLFCFLLIGNVVFQTVYILQCYPGTLMNSKSTYSNSFTVLRSQGNSGPTGPCLTRYPTTVRTLGLAYTSSVLCRAS